MPIAAFSLSQSLLTGWILMPGSWYFNKEVGKAARSASDQDWKEEHVFPSVYMISFFSSGLSALLPLHASPSSVQSAKLWEFVGAVARSSTRRLGRTQLEYPAVSCFQNSAHWPKQERTSLKPSTGQKWLNNLMERSMMTPLCFFLQHIISTQYFLLQQNH